MVITKNTIRVADILIFTFFLLLYQRNVSGEMLFFNIVLFGIYSFINNKLNMPVHEVGHLILGKLMGFNLILISFWGISITRNNDWVRIERSHDNQCLMKYNSNPDKLTLSYCIMLSGGFIFNFIFSLISLMLFFAVDNYYLELFLYTAFLVGFINYALPVKNYVDLS
ncbi:MAG: hypothetical protein LKG18_06400 [Saccharofermentans sp.]|nr:hypothetical protein [Saccharofermentans sp.]